MSGSVIGGVLGAAIGFMVPGVGPALGWMLGSVAGGILMPPEMEGPRLSDLRPQGSEYGRPIPIVKGTAAISGNVIWQTDLVEVPSESGGSGSPSVIEYTYYANFAVLLCEGEVTLGRIWAGPEKRLIYDGTTLEGGGTITFYSGSDTQNPDPLMESHEGAGNVPAYRGYAYVVFENFPVVNDGNAIPFLTVEVGNVTTTSASLGSVWPVGPVLIDEAAQTFSVTYSGTNDGVVTRSLVDQSFVSNYEWEGYKGSTHSFLDPDRNVAVYLDLDTLTWIDLSDGSTDTFSVAGWPGLSHTDWRPVGGVYHNGTYCFLMHNLVGTGVAISVLDPDSLATTPASLAFHEGDAGFVSQGLVVGFCDHYNDASAYILGVTKVGTVRKFPLSAGFTSTSCGACVANATEVAKDPNTGNVWTATFSGSTFTVACNSPVTAAQLYTEVLVTDAWDIAGGTRRASPWVFNGDDGRVLVLAEKWNGIDYFIEFESGANATPAHLQNIVGIYRGTGDINAGWYNTTSGQYWFVRDSGWANSTKSAANDLTDVGLWDYDPDYGYQLGETGMTQAGELLSDVITDLCTRAGLTEIDVSDLTTDTVDGYVIAQQTTVRGAIQTLQPAFFFDAVESGGIVKFVKRGGASVVTIPDDDLGAFEAGGSPDDDLLMTTRRMEDELPSALTIKYISRATNYENATKHSRRLIGGSGDEQSLDLPIVMSDTKGQEIAEINLHKAWVGRKTYQFNLPLKYAYLEPTDVITISDQTMMLTKASLSGGVIKCEGVFDDYNYTPHVVVTETEQSGSTTVFTPSPTRCVLMNLVALRSQDTDAGFYAAACGTVADRWRGAILYQSKDAGTTWSKVGTFANPATMGLTTNALANYTGGSAIDTVSTFNVDLEYGELSSTTDAGFAAGTNAAAIGEEIVFFRDAVLQGDGTYTGDHLLRGQLGSGSEISGHATGENFVLLSTATVIRIPAQPSDIGQPYLYRAVSVGSSFDDAAEFEFTITGASYNPAAPVDVAQPATLYGYDAVNSSGLTWAYYGGAHRKADGTIVLITAGTVTLTDNATNYIYATDAGVVTVTTTEPAAWPAPLADDAVALYEVVVSGGVVQSYIDYRTAGRGGSSSASGVTVEDEGVNVVAGATEINFTGSGVTVTDVGGVPTIDIPGISAQPFDLTAFYPGVPSASALVTRVPVARAITFSTATTTGRGSASVAATSQTDFDVKLNGASVGTIRFAAGASTGSFIAASPITTAAGDVVSIHAPSSADATLADVGFVLAGTR